MGHRKMHLLMHYGPTGKFEKKREIQKPTIFPKIK
jgi:hypothetical protein